MEQEKYIIFGNGAKQLETYDKLKSGLKLSDCSVKTTKHLICKKIKCVGKDSTFVCTKITSRYTNGGCSSCYCFCTIEWKNGKTKKLYGTVPMMLFDAYANQGKTK